MNITKGKISSAQKVVIYGPEGIGKSTFAANFPDPLFIDTEGSTKQLDVARMDKPTSWAMLGNQIAYVKANPDVCKTLVIDTIDWAEQLCIDSICSRYEKKGIEDFGYGNGYVYEKEEFGRFLNSLDDLIEKGINVVLTAHAQLRKFSQPDEIGEYDRWELKLGKKTGSQISPLVKEWADMVLFANYKTFAVAADKEGNKFKAQGGGRIMYTQHHPCWDAKNRHGLAEELPFDFSQIAGIFAATSETISAQKIKSSTIPSKETPKRNEVSESPENVKTEPPKTQQEVIGNISDFEDVTPANIPDNLPKALKDLMKANNVDESEIRLAVSLKGYFPDDMPVADYPPDFINGCLIAAWEQVFEMIKSNREVPFS